MTQAITQFLIPSTHNIKMSSNRNPMNKSLVKEGELPVAQASYAGSVYVPIFQAHAVFASLPPAFVPPEIANFVSPELWTTLNSLSTFQIRYAKFECVLKMCSSHHC